MKAATICSGIGAPEVAMPHWTWLFQSEIEDAPRQVLIHRHHAQDARRPRGDGPALWGDFTTIRVRFLRRLGIELPEWLVAGTPCQAFSLAGLRKSMSDSRGNLTMEFVRLVHALRRAGSLRGIVWENVPGVLSTPDNAFGCFLGGLVRSDHPLPRPGGGAWPDAGMVAGGGARVAWRVLDAQHFGVPQQRARVLLVADFVGGVDPAAILFERRSVRGNPAKGRKKRKDIAGTLTVGSSNGGGGPGARTDEAAYGYLQPVERDAALMVMATGQANAEIAAGASPALTCNHEAPIVFDTTQITHPENRSNPQPGAPCHALPASGHAPTIAFTAKDYGADAMEETAPVLRSGAHDGSHQNGGVMPAITTPIGVRRLMPVECERLQGFEDDFTLVPNSRGKPMADGPRYKMLGNSKAVPCIGWVLERVENYG